MYQLTNMQTISLFEFILVSTGSILIYVLIKTIQQTIKTKQNDPIN